jgi:hypothetical protein
LTFVLWRSNVAVSRKQGQAVTVKRNGKTDTHEISGGKHAFVITEKVYDLRMRSLPSDFKSADVVAGLWAVVHPKSLELRRLSGSRPEPMTAVFGFPAVHGDIVVSHAEISSVGYILIRCDSGETGPDGGYSWYTVNEKLFNKLVSPVNSSDLTGASSHDSVADDSVFLRACVVPSNLAAAVSCGLPNWPERSDIVAVAYGNLDPVAARKLGIIQARNITGRVSYGVAATATGRLLCCIEGTVLWETQLPFGSRLHNAKVELQLTSSAQTPLVLAGCAGRLLVLDVLYRGVVIREFTHVGAYMLAHWFDSLTEQLLVLPVSTVSQLSVQAVTHGRVLVPLDSKSTVDSIATHANGDHCGDSTLPLTDWFVYELPRSSGIPGGTGAVACRSMSPRGVWREGTLGCVCDCWQQFARRVRYLL